MAEENPKVEENVEEPTTIEETEGDKAEVKKTNEPRLARVEYDYQEHESDELSLNIGDVVTVLEQGDGDNKGGWWKGDLNGKIGMFPSNHVKLIEVSIQSAEDGEESENPEGRKKKTLNKYGVKPGGIGSLFSGGIQVGLKKRSQPSPENSSVSEEKHAIASAPVLKKTSLPPVSPVNQQSSPPLPHLPPKKKPPKPKKVEPMAEVIYDYEAEAEADDEISLSQGTYVTILEKVDEDGWWKVKDEQGKSGLCPSTYIKEIKQAEVQQKSQPIPKEVIESNVVEIERYESSEDPAMTTQEVFTSEPASVSADSPIHSSSQDTHGTYEEDSPTLPTSPPPSTTNETSPTPNRRSTYESSQAAAPQRRSTHESTSPTLPQRSSSHDGEEHVTSRRPPSVVSPDLPPIQSISTKRNSVESIDTTISPEERPAAPPRQLSRSSSLYENKTDSPKSSPTLAKPPVLPKTFSPAKPPVVPLPPVKRSSSSASKSDKSKNETSLTEPISPKINRRTSHDQYDASTVLSGPENKDDNNIEDEEQIEQTDVVEETSVEEKIDDKEAEISEEEEAKDDKEVIAETAETKEDEDTTGGHEVEPEEKKSPPPQLPPMPSGPKLTNLGKDRPAIKNRKIPSMKSVKENASQSQTAILMEAVASAKDEEEPKPQTVASPPTPPKPEKPVKPNTFKLQTLGGGVQLRPVAKKPPIETSTESTETTTSSTASSSIDTKPISGGVKGISSRFNQFGGIPNSSDVEFRLKKWFNEEINKVKSHFEAQLAEERSKREALEEELRELIARLQE